MPFWGNKLYGRKESFLTKYYCIRSKLTVFQKFLTFSFKAISIIGQMRTFFRQRIPWSSYEERKCRHRHLTTSMNGDKNYAIYYNNEKTSYENKEVEPVQPV